MLRLSLLILLFLHAVREEAQLKREESYSLYQPQNKKAKGNILFLNGWNMDAAEICTASSLCLLAEKNGYNIIVPHMGKSVYASIDTKFTRNDYRQLKKISWLSDSLLPRLESKGIYFNQKGNNHIIGLSTGARGAVLFAALNPEMFQSLVLISGDYDQCLDTEDKLMINTYGPYELNKEVWTMIDNPLRESEKIRSAIFIAHGMNDKVVKTMHSILLEKKLKEKGYKEGVNIQTWYPPQDGHHWAFWQAAIDKGFEFILKSETTISK